MTFVHKSFSILSLVSTLVVCAVFFLVFQPVEAADTQFTPSTGSYNVGQTFTVTAQVVPDSGEQVNAVEATISFDPELLSVVSVSRDGSVFSLWTTEPTFSNTDGTVTFGGGSPTPFSSRSNLITITLRALAEGTATLEYSSASALAADGLGTDVFNTGVPASFVIESGAVAPEPTPQPQPEPDPQPEPEPESDDAIIAFGEAPRAPVVGSQTFLDPDTWYATNTALFTWEVPFDVTEIALDIATSADSVPETIYEPPIEEILLTADDLREGIQYLTIRYRNQVDWGTVTHRKIQVDTVPPEEFIIRVNPGNSTSSFPTLTFNAVDRTSGIDFYELSISDGEPDVVTPGEAEIGYLLSELKNGTYTVVVDAYDMAGNVRRAETEVIIEAGWIPPSELPQETSFWSFITPTSILIFILVLLNLAQFAFQIFERRRASQREEKLRKETREIQDQMEKIFSALRDEIYDQISTITKRPRLSKKEREAVEGLNNALEVSETLIEKEINDVKKILR